MKRCEETMTSSQNKKILIEWVIKNISFRKKEILWIFKHLISGQINLNKVHFMEAPKSNKKTIIINVSGVEGKPFEFKKNGIGRYDEAHAYHDIRHHPNEDIYIVLHFRGKNENPKYLAALEKDSQAQQKIVEQNLQYAREAQKFLEYCMKKYKLERLEKELDEALVERDEAKFKQLVIDLQQLRKEIAEQEA